MDETWFAYKGNIIKVKKKKKIQKHLESGQTSDKSIIEVSIK